MSKSKNFDSNTINNISENHELAILVFFEASLHNLD